MVRTPARLPAATSVNTWSPIITVFSGEAPMSRIARRRAKGAGFMAWSTTSTPSSRAVRPTWLEWKLLETRQSPIPAARAASSQATTSGGAEEASRGTQVLSRSSRTSRTSFSASSPTSTRGSDAT